MSYIGSHPAASFAKATSQTFTGNNSDVTFTLNKRVSNPEDLEVFVSNVQQQPTTSYTIDSDGVTLRFSEAPPSGQFYVVYRNLVQQTGIDTGAARLVGNNTLTGDQTITGDTSLKGNVVINEDSADKDFRVETDGKTHAFFVEGSSDNLAMGTTTPTFATGNGLHLGDDFQIGFGDGNGTRPDFQMGYDATNTRLRLICGTGSDDTDMFFTTGGALEIGTATQPTGQCASFHNNSGAATLRLRNSNGGNNLFQGLNLNGAQSSYITESGVGYFANGVSSDETLKNVKGVMNDGWSKLKDIQPKSFTWKKVDQDGNKSDDDLDGNIHYGVMAQDLKKVIPDLAYGKEGGMSVDYNGLLMVAINTIKELEARIKALEE